jgi:hypothetical protein
MSSIDFRRYIMALQLDPQATHEFNRAMGSLFAYSFLLLGSKFRIPLAQENHTSKV